VAKWHQTHDITGEKLKDEITWHPATQVPSADRELFSFLLSERVSSYNQQQLRKLKWTMLYELDSNCLLAQPTFHLLYQPTDTSFH
jgi:hypothetical protein